VTYPGGWGPVESLEPQVLTLLELRLLLVEPQGDTEGVQVRYLEHVDEAVGAASTLPLAARLESSTARVVEVLRGFVVRERAWQDALGSERKTPRSA
jgi:hypothetical protein